MATTYMKKWTQDEQDATITRKTRTEDTNHTITITFGLTEHRTQENHLLEITPTTEAKIETVNFDENTVESVQEALTIAETITTKVQSIQDDSKGTILMTRDEIDSAHGAGVYQEEERLAGELHLVVIGHSGPEARQPDDSIRI